MNNQNDARTRALRTWVQQGFGERLAWQTVSADASFRRYFRVRSRDGASPERRWIVVDSPPDIQANQAFVEVAQLMADAGLNVPRVLAFDHERGFGLLTDLGDRSFLDVLDEHNADALYGAAIGALLDWQASSRPDVLPAYDRATFAREMNLFVEWYLPAVRGGPPTASERAGIEQAFGFILDQICAQPQVFVHRDYMPRNLMISDPLPGVLDFQDARYGPVGYDVASLFRDAFISWPDSRINGWLRHYFDAAVERGIPVGRNWSRFVDDVALIGAQRHLKILGLFVRIDQRDGKPRYRADLDRFIDYLDPVVARFAELAPLAPLLDRALHTHAARVAE
ncbi:MAG: phosphotransferase [Salinisphaera sp.]|nr:phosphotransferase [Salinisphaera sp.]